MRILVSSLLVSSLAIHFTIYVLSYWVIQGIAVRDSHLPAISAAFSRHHFLFTVPVILLALVGLYLLFRKRHQSHHLFIFVGSWLIAESLFVSYAALAIFAPLCDVLWIALRQK